LKILGGKIPLSDDMLEKLTEKDDKKESMPLRQVIEEEDQKAANDNALDEWFS
jgi:hypothetical protein